jgi:hypothetical protein
MLKGMKRDLLGTFIGRVVWERKGGGLFASFMLSEERR